MEAERKERESTKITLEGEKNKSEDKKSGKSEKSGKKEGSEKQDDNR